MSNSLVTVLMPTYNDLGTIVESIQSIINQTYENWQLIVINDDSNVSIKDIISNFKDNRIDLIEKTENSGQLDALWCAISYIKGDYVTILHSDDLLHKEAFNDMVDFLNKDSKYQGAYSDLTIIDKNSKEIALSYYVNRVTNESKYNFLYSPSNIIPDIFFVRVNYFISNVIPNYILKNTPYWLSLDHENESQLIKLPHSYYLYRRGTGINYDNEQIGKFVLLNGCLRVTRLAVERYASPFYVLQKFIWQVITRVHPFNSFYSYIFKPIVYKRKYPNRHIEKTLLKRIIVKIYKGETFSNDYLNLLYSYYSNPNTKSTKISLGGNIEPVFLPKDINKFYTLLINQSLPSIYQSIINHLKGNGWLHFYVNSKDSSKALEQILDFLNIPASITINN